MLHFKTLDYKLCGNHRLFSYRLHWIFVKQYLASLIYMLL